MKFKVGNKIMCINNKEYNHKLSETKIYTIATILHTPYNFFTGIRLKGLGNWEYDINRFKLYKPYHRIIKGLLKDY